MVIDSLHADTVPRQPNILLIVADDLGFADVGFNGGKTVPTPNLDRLAATGINLAGFHAAPICSPTRAGLMTGRWPLHFGMMRAVVPPWSSYGLPSTEQTLPELLGSAGYAPRGIMGKWHLGHARYEFLPLQNGFTEFYGHYNGAIDYFSHEREGELDWHRGTRTVDEKGYSTDLLAAEAAHFISKAGFATPWFLYLPFNAPHSPYKAKDEDLKKYLQIKGPQRRAYAAMVDSLDQAVGRVISAVEARADATNTLVLFFSDNGGILRVGSSNGPMRGEKLTVYEGGTHVCATIRWPAGGLTGGQRFEGLVGYIDVLPTLLAAARARIPENLDGIDFLSALRGETPTPHRPWFSYIHQSERAQASVQEGPWKLVVHGEPFETIDGATNRLELYDLNADPSERKNVASEHPEVTTRLHTQLRNFGKLQKPGVSAYSEGRKDFHAPTRWIIEPDAQTLRD